MQAVSTSLRQARSCWRKLPTVQVPSLSSPTSKWLLANHCLQWEGWALCIQHQPAQSSKCAAPRHHCHHESASQVSSSSSNPVTLALGEDTASYHLLPWRFFFYSLWVSIQTSDSSWIKGTHSLPSYLPLHGVFLHLDGISHERLFSLLPTTLPSSQKSQVSILITLDRKELWHNGNSNWKTCSGCFLKGDNRRTVGKGKNLNFLHVTKSLLVLCDSIMSLCYSIK